MPAKEIIEKTNDQLIVENSDRVFIAQSDKFNIPDAHSGKQAYAFGIITNVKLTTQEESDLEAAIEAITGVELAKSLITVRLAHDRMPADIPPPGGTDHQFQIFIQMGADVVAVDNP